MSASDPLSERGIILAPHGRDAQLAALILKEADLVSAICMSLPALSQELDRGAALAIIAEEAVLTADLRPLTMFVESQPAWSDFPFLLLTHRGTRPERNPAASRLAEILGNVTFLERPFHPTTFISLVRSAVRGRRRQYEARARLVEISEGERRLQTALRAGHLGSWTLTADDMVFQASESTKAHFGSGPEQPFSYDDLCRAAHPDDISDVRLSIASSLRTGADFIIEYRTLWPDSSVHWLELRAGATLSPSGAVTQLVGVSTDITNRRISELERERLLNDLADEREALSELSQTLEKRIQERTTELMREVSARENAQQQLIQSQKMESIGKLTGGIAHDFNNLLTVVITTLYLLKKQLPTDDRSQRLITGAMQAAERGAALTQRMLAFARQQDLKTSSIDVGALLDGMRDLLERSLGPGIALSLQIARGLPPALIDPNQVELAILNLAINGRDAMPEGGSIVISVDQEQLASDQTLGDDSYIRVQVSDTGLGMDASTLEKAVEPFFSTKPLGKGTGLGLSMVHGLAVQLGGLLELASAPGKGTVATLWLPIARTRATRPEVPATLAAKGRSATILVVDDDALVAMSMTDMLEDLGHKVIGVNSGKQALEILESHQTFDLMITDHAMPGMTGVELAKIARGKRPDMPILLATGYADLPHGQNSNLPRLSKPYHQAQLQAEVEKLLAPQKRSLEAAQARAVSRIPPLA
jgi:signal transduction histidine kinase/FixJ family two-component response regulator